MNYETYEKLDNIITLTKNNNMVLNELEKMIKLETISNEVITDEYIRQFSTLSKLVSETIWVAHNYQDKLVLKEDSIFVKDITNTFGINIKCEGCKIVIDCPAVDLHRKRIDGAIYYFSALQIALMQFKETAEYREWNNTHLSNEMTIFFIHEFEKQSVVVDTDNLDCKNIIDTLEMLGYIKSDRGNNLMHIHKSEISGRFHTKISLFPTSEITLKTP